MTLIRLGTSLLALASASAFAAPRQRVIANVVSDQYRPLAFDRQEIAGLLGEHLRAVREGYLEHADEQASVASAERAGIFLDAAANAYDYSRDPNLKVVMDRAAKELESTESPSNLLGLLAYYRVTRDENALMAAEKIGGLQIAQLNRAPIPTLQQSGALIAPLTYLYRYANDPRYLNLSESIANSLVHSGRLSDSVSEGTLPGLIGLIELYRSTGDRSYYRAVAEAWPTLRDRTFSFLNGSAGISDSCVTAQWVELSLELLRLTGYPQYGEELERIVYNQLFAAQDSKTGHIFSRVPLDGSKQLASPADRCAPSEAAGISTIPAAVWGRYGNGIAVILYTAGRATFRLRRRGTVQIYSESTYPSTGEMLLHVEPAHSIHFPLRLRVPEWTSSFVVDAAGSHLIGKPGEFLTLNRQWNRGDTVKIAINMTVHAIAGGGSQPGVALQRGPQLLALSKALNRDVENLAAAGPAVLNPAQLALAPLNAGFPANWAGEQVYKIAGEYEDKPCQLILVPFADAVAYRVFMKVPSAASGATGYQRPASLVPRHQ